MPDIVPPTIWHAEQLKRLKESEPQYAKLLAGVTILSGRCQYLSPTAKRIGLRMWHECGNGFGSVTRDGRRGHCTTCPTPAANVWRIDAECGPGCSGFAVAG
jgi:hypothetical protein